MKIVIVFLKVEDLFQFRAAEIRIVIERDEIFPRASQQPKAVSLDIGDLGFLKK
ncbi:MAG: hypothetical protein AB1554_04260 [Chloroflexota bacterium]